MRFGILTSGGDCAGLNAVIRAIGLYLTKNARDAEIVGIPEGYGGLIRGESYPLSRENFFDILDVGGTILRTSRQPYKKMTAPEEGGSRLSKMVANYKKMGLDCLFTLGGAGTHKTAALLSMEGCNVIGVPKTIDNDIYGTDVTFGFQTAVEVATDAVCRIETTARSHSRIMLVEIMGNKAGWLTLHTGIAAGAQMILIPEIPFSVDAVCDFLNARVQAGERYTMVAVAEGALLESEARFKKDERAFVRARSCYVYEGAPKKFVYRLKFGGRLALCNRADRLAEVLYTLKEGGLEPKRVQFVRGKAGAKPYLLLAEAVKGARPGTEILPDVVNVREETPAGVCSASADAAAEGSAASGGKGE